MKSAQVRILSAVSSASATGAQFDVNQIVSASFVPNSADNTAAGTVKLQCCNQVPTNDRQNFVGTIWADIPNATSLVAAGVGPAIVVPNMCFSYVRAIFTRTGGGSATAITVDMNELSA